MIRSPHLPMTLDAHDDQSGFDEGGPRSRARRTSVYLLIVLVVLLLLVFLPPLINVSGFQRRVDENISAALGRPVHFDRLSLNLLPMPGFTLENFIIEEDPAFGYEPTLHANEVRINLRPSSLWRHRFEFSSISFTDPSVNLVHASDGRWNIQGLLLQASRISAAPTAQAHAGPAPRFPYIEASGARVNLKLGEEKMPISLTDADFALWQPAEHQWRLRIAAHPLRTDTAPGASGTFRVEGTLGGDGGTRSLAA
jgi:AsmA protein